jgi:hypothetical protein
MDVGVGIITVAQETEGTIRGAGVAVAVTVVVGGTTGTAGILHRCTAGEIAVEGVETSRCGIAGVDGTTVAVIAIKGRPDIDAVAAAVADIRPVTNGQVITGRGRTGNRSRFKTAVRSTAPIGTGIRRIALFRPFHRPIATNGDHDIKGIGLYILFPMIRI